ncbi:hypothetical protein GIB67_007736 [Kingdonia uniflora]|uniref:Uncharacterized protein n=1 Tax=Kingdonia uniflora TaxID=39325 RepID=A0A7J7N1Q6_9MAGN|nr:hypothetical protein GIB67_007736 [Kingdonia uniflora]
MRLKIETSIYKLKTKLVKTGSEKHLWRKGEGSPRKIRGSHLKGTDEAPTICENHHSLHAPHQSGLLPLITATASASLESAALEESKEAVMEFDYHFKIVLIGDSGVGKSSIFSAFQQNPVDSQSKQNTGTQFATIYLKVDGKKVVTEIWDNTGQEGICTMQFFFHKNGKERYEAIQSCDYNRGVVGALLIYDVTKWQAFNNVTISLRELRNHAGSDIVVIMIGAKKLEESHRRQVSEAEANTFSEKNKISFIETPGLSRSKIEMALMTIVTKIISNKATSLFATENGFRIMDKNKILYEQIFAKYGHEGKGSVVEASLDLLSAAMQELLNLVTAIC